MCCLYRCPDSPEDPLDILGSSRGFLSDTGHHAVRRTPWDPPLVFPRTQAPKLCGGSLGHPGILPWCPLRHRPTSCSEDPLNPPLVSPQTQAPMLSRGSLGHLGILPWCSLRHRPPNCPEGPLDNPGSSLGVPSDTAPHVVWRIPWISRDPPLVPPQTQAPVFSSINDQCIVSISSLYQHYQFRKCPLPPSDDEEQKAELAAC